MNKFRIKFIKNLLGEPITLHAKFHQKTKIPIRRISALNSTSPDKKIQTNSYKDYPRLEKIFLPPPRDLSRINLQKLLQQRKSTRQYSNRTLDIDTLSTLLKYCAGENNQIDKKNSHRFYPSAGAKYPLELYFISLNSEIDKALYHYNVKQHSLENIGPLKNFSLKNYILEFDIKNPAGLIIVSAVFNRTIEKYGNRGYRHIMQEAGYMGQLIYLLSAALGLGCCAAGGFVDDKFNKLLDLDGSHESVVSVFSIGLID